VDINIQIKLESPGLMAAILAVAEALPKVHLNASMPEKQDQVSEITETNDIPDSNNEEPVKIVTLEEVRTKLAGLSQSGKQAEVKSLIKKFGAIKLTDIPKEKYPELLKAAEEI
jgi:hypothetical protein